MFFICSRGRIRKWRCGFVDVVFVCFDLDPAKWHNGVPRGFPLQTTTKGTLHKTAHPYVYSKLSRVPSYQFSWNLTFGGPFKFTIALHPSVRFHVNWWEGKVPHLSGSMCGFVGCDFVLVSWSGQRLATSLASLASMRQAALWALLLRAGFG